MQEYAVSFFGHRRIDNASAVEKQLEAIVCDLLTAQSYVTFLVGRDEDFDLLAASVIHRCQRQIRSDNSALVWVMPYVSFSFQTPSALFPCHLCFIGKNARRLCSTGGGLAGNDWDQVQD